MVSAIRFAWSTGFTGDSLVSVIKEKYLSISGTLCGLYFEKRVTR
jgi:hypothetical protein